MAVRRRQFLSRATKVLLCCGGLLWCLLGYYNLFGSNRTYFPLAAAAVDHDDAHQTLTMETATPPDSADCWAYTHLQKAGGTTIKNLLFDFWGTKSTTYDSYQWKKGQGYADSVAVSLASPTGLNAVAGGYPEALRNTLALRADGTGNESSCRWFTVFRHPVSRLLSAFYYCRCVKTTKEIVAVVFWLCQRLFCEKHWLVFLYSGQPCPLMRACALEGTQTRKFLSCFLPPVCV